MQEGVDLIEMTSSLKGLTEFIAEHPEFVSITSFNVNDPDSGVFYNENEPRTLGATANIFLLIEYERQVHQGILNPEEEISLSALDIFSLPELNENNHDAFQNDIKGKSAALDEIVAKLITHNDLSVSDYLWLRLGEENTRNLVSDLGFPEKAMPLPFSGLYVMLNPALNDTSELKSLSQAEISEKAISTAQKLKSDEEFRNSVKDAFDDNRLSLTFMQERDALKYFPQSSTKKMAALMANLVNGKVISAEVSEKVIQKLRWPETSDSAIKTSFTEYGAVYDGRMGLLGGIDFGTSIYDGHTSVQAIYFDRLPVAFWMHMSSGHMHKDFQQRLIWDPALFETTINEITSSNE